MKKAADLRVHLTQWVPDLAKNPEKLHLLIEKGRISTRLGGGLGFEYQFTVQVIVTEFAESADCLIVPLLVWLQTNQPDLLLDPERRQRAIEFEAEISAHDKIDIALSLDLSERVLVNPKYAGGYECEHLGEPQLPDLSGPTGWVLYNEGQPLEP